MVDKAEKLLTTYLLWENTGNTRKEITAGCKQNIAEVSSKQRNTEHKEIVMKLNPIDLGRDS